MGCAGILNSTVVDCANAVGTDSGVKVTMSIATVMHDAKKPDFLTYVRFEAYRSLNISSPALGSSCGVRRSHAFLVGLSCSLPLSVGHGNIHSHFFTLD